MASGYGPPSNVYDPDRAIDVAALDNVFSKLYDDGLDDRPTGSSGDGWFVVHAGELATDANGK